MNQISNGGENHQRKETSHKREKRSAVDLYVETAAVIDYGLYARYFLSRMLDR